MAFDDKIRLGTDQGDLLRRQANVDIYHTVALHTGQMVVMALPTGAVFMAPICKINPVQQAQANQHLNCAEDRRAPHAPVDLAQILPEFFNTKIHPNV